MLKKNLKCISHTQLFNEMYEQCIFASRNVFIQSVLMTKTNGKKA